MFLTQKSITRKTNEIGMFAEVMDQIQSLEGVLVTGTAVVRLQGNCARCLDEISREEEVDIQELYSGTRTVEVPPEAVDRFYGQGWLDAPQGLLPNEFITIVDSTNPATVFIGATDTNVFYPPTITSTALSSSSA